MALITLANVLYLNIPSILHIKYTSRNNFLTFAFHLVNNFKTFYLQNVF